MAVQVFLLELVVIGFICLTHEVLDKIWELPAGSRSAERDRRMREGCCVACGYSMTGNVSGACPECGMSPQAALAANNVRRPLPNSLARWAIAVLVSAVIAYVLVSIVL